MNFSHRASLIPKVEPDLRAHPGGVAVRPGQPDAQTWLRANVVIKLRLGAVLRYHQIDSTILVVVGQGRPALLAVNFDAGFLSWNRNQFSLAIAPQPKAAPRIQARHVRLRAEEILA